MLESGSVVFCLLNRGARFCSARVLFNSRFSSVSASVSSERGTRTKSCFDKSSTSSGDETARGSAVTSPRGSKAPTRSLENRMVAGGYDSMEVQSRGGWATVETHTRPARPGVGDGVGRSKKESLDVLRAVCIGTAAGIAPWATTATQSACAGLCLARTWLDLPTRSQSRFFLPQTPRNMATSTDYPAGDRGAPRCRGHGKLRCFQVASLSSPPERPYPDEAPSRMHPAALDGWSIPSCAGQGPPAARKALTKRA